MKSAKGDVRYFEVDAMFDGEPVEVLEKIIRTRLKRTRGTGGNLSFPPPSQVTELVQGQLLAQSLSIVVHVRLCASSLEQPPTAHKTYLIHGRLRKKFE